MFGDSNDDSELEGFWVKLTDFENELGKLILGLNHTGVC